MYEPRSLTRKLVVIGLLSSMLTAGAIVWRSIGNGGFHRIM